MIHKLLMIFGIIFTLNGCGHLESGTVIYINGVTQNQYEQIREDVRNVVTHLNPPFDCSSDDSYAENRKQGELICFSDDQLSTDINRSNMRISYSGGTEFWIPTKGKITDEHKKMKALFVRLAAKYQKQYPKSKVEVIFYHHDLPKQGKRLF